MQEELGDDIKEVTLDMLGQAEKVTIRKDRTLIVGGAGDKAAINERLDMLHTMLKNAKNEFDVDKARERLGKLGGGAAVIRVGAPTEIEMKENKLRIEDALNATRAAVEEGIVAGGGTALCDVIPAVKAYTQTLEGDQKTGAEIILRALEGTWHSRLRRMQASMGMLSLVRSRKNPRALASMQRPASTCP